jgi:hypothetical protein
VVSLRKQDNDSELVAVVPDSGTLEGINHTIVSYPASYFITVVLTTTGQRFYSVNIDYTYTEPVAEP